MVAFLFHLSEPFDTPKFDTVKLLMTEYNTWLIFSIYSLMLLSDGYKAMEALIATHIY